MNMRNAGRSRAGADVITEVDGGDEILGRPAEMTLHNTIYRGGSGVPMVLIHAFPVDHHMWDECAANIIDLADECGVASFPLWAPDMPGAGASPVPSSAQTGRVETSGAYPEALDAMSDAYVGLLRKAGYRQAVWVGLSMGGYVALDVQRRHPEAVAGLVLCDTTASADADGGTKRLGVASAALNSHSVEPVMHFARPQEGDSSVKRGERFQEQMSGWIDRQSPAGVAWRQCMAAGRPDLNDVLPSVTAPSAVVSGQNDPSSPPSAMKPLAERMGQDGAVFTQIEDCGHFSAVEHPDIVARALIEVMKRVQQAS